MEGDCRICGTTKRNQRHFNPLPPHGGRRLNSYEIGSAEPFQSTPSAWRETVAVCVHNHRTQFQSTPSAWRETFFTGDDDRYSIYFNPLPPHGGRQGTSTRNYRNPGISIHSLRMEGDIITPLLYLSALIFQSTPSAWRETCAMDMIFRCRIKISIHSLRMEGDDKQRRKEEREKPFQSTPSAWRETQDVHDTEQRPVDFNPLPPHGGRPPSGKSGTTSCHISIHSLRMEGDGIKAAKSDKAKLFQSTPSAWRETYSQPSI